MDSRVYTGTYFGSDYNLVFIIGKLKLHKPEKETSVLIPPHPHPRWNQKKLKTNSRLNSEKQSTNDDINSHGETFKTVYIESAMNVPGPIKREKHKGWISGESWEKEAVERNV